MSQPAYGPDHDAEWESRRADFMQEERDQWRALYIAENAARKDAEARLRGILWLIGGAILAAGVIVALCGALTGAEAASHAVARHQHRQETSR